MEIFVDVRERALLQALQTQGGARVGARALAVGDAVVGRWVVERKTLADLAASLVDGRFRDQRSRLLRHVAETPGARACYVVEGFPGPSRDALPRVLGALVSLAHRGIPVIPTPDVAATAWALRRLGERDASGGAGDEAAEYEPRKALGRRARGDAEQVLEAMLCQVEGVSRGTAAAIRARFPSMGAVVEACQDGSIGTVAGVGPARVRALCAALAPKELAESR